MKELKKAKAAGRSEFIAQEQDVIRPEDLARMQNGTGADQESTPPDIIIEN